MSQNHIISIFYAIFPAIIYSWVLFMFIPKKMVGKHRIRRYLSAAFLSPILVLLIHYAFPDIWSKIPYPQFVTRAHLLFTYIIEVALVEELTKFITYIWVTSHRKNSRHDYPIATLFYCMMSAAGFAIVENIYYLINWGESVLFIRSITAIIMHLNCGIIMGYFIALSKFYSFKKEIDIPYITYNPFKKILLITTGIIGAILFHGIYNYSIAISQIEGNFYIPLVVIIFGIISSILLTKELISFSKKLKEKEMVKELEL